MSETAVRASFHRQAAACNKLGSPFTARLCSLLADRLTDATAVGRRILSWPGDASASGDAVPLRLAGALHALVLAKADADLVATYPPRETDDDTLWRAVANALEAHGDFILGRLASAPQTNEVRRSAALLPGFLAIAALAQKPLRLLEVGASAGLNLHWDRYAYRLGTSAWGDPSSSVHLQPDWTGPAPLVAPIEIAERAGCDLNPLDPARAEDRQRLLSYIWADQFDRLDRTRAALSIAAETDLKVARADAVIWLSEQLASSSHGVATVIYHSIAWQYLPEAARAKGDALVVATGARATRDAPLFRLAMEADGNSDGAALTLQSWPTGETRSLGRTDFHGRWVKWIGFD
jgi:hypothetical protein